MSNSIKNTTPAENPEKKVQYTTRCREVAKHYGYEYVRADKNADDTVTVQCKGVFTNEDGTTANREVYLVCEITAKRIIVLSETSFVWVKADEQTTEKNEIVTA